MNSPIEIDSFEHGEVRYIFEHAPGQQSGRGDRWRIMAKWINKPNQPARQLKIFTDGAIAEEDFMDSVISACRWSRVAFALLVHANVELGSSDMSTASRGKVELTDTLIVPTLFHDLEEVKRRVQNGYDVNTELIFRGASRSYSFTPLHFAAKGHQHYHGQQLIQTPPAPLIMGYLIACGADVHARSCTGLTPLHEAMSAEAARLLLDHGADVSSTSINGDTPLHYADNAAIATVLLEHGADLHARNNNGQTPLHYSKNATVAALMLDHGADLLTRDNDGLIAEDLFKKRATETSKEDRRANYLLVHQFLKSRRERQELLDIAKQTRQKTDMIGSADKRRAF